MPEQAVSNDNIDDDGMLLVAVLVMVTYLICMKEMLYAVRCLKSNEDMIREVMGSNPVESPEFFRFMRQLLKNCPASARIISSFDFI